MEYDVFDDSAMTHTELVLIDAGHMGHMARHVSLDDQIIGSTLFFRLVY